MNAATILMLFLTPDEGVDVIHADGIGGTIAVCGVFRGSLELAPAYNGHPAGPETIR